MANENWGPPPFMRFVPSVIAALLLISCAVFTACDGHAKHIHLPQSATRIGRTQAKIPVESFQKIELVALSLGLVAIPENEAQWSIKSENGAVFSMSAVPVSSGGWNVILKDWPSFARSDLSKQAEQLLKEDLKNEK